MENQKQRDQAKNQKQKQQQANKTSATAATTTKVHLDPIQSIANVLNHHHSEQQKSKHNKQHQQVSTEGKNVVSVSAPQPKLSAVGQPNSNEESSGEVLRGHKRSGQKSVKQQVDRVTGRPLLLTVDNNNSSSKNSGSKSAAKQQADAESDRNVRQAASDSPPPPTELSRAFKQLAGADLVVSSSKGDHHLATGATAASSSLSASATHNSQQDYKCAQVDQGNSYLYAYNDFITPSAHLSASSSSSSPSSSSSAAPNQIGGVSETGALVSSSKGNKQLASGHDLRIARQQTKQQIRSSGSKQANKTSVQLPQVCLLTGETLLSTANDNEDESNKASNLASSKLAPRRANKDRPANQQQQQQQRRHEQEGAQVGHNDNESAEQPDKSGSDEDDDDDDEETLSYILNRHNLLVAQQRQAALAANQRLHNHHHQQHQNCNLLHLNQQLDHAGSVPAHLVCDGHQLASPVVENPNHLRRYLQIEENFNSYKAARRKSRRGGAASQAIVDSASVYQQRPLLVGADDELALGDQDLQQHRPRASTNKQYASSSFLPYQLEPNLIAVNGASDQQQQQVNLSSSSLSSSQSSLANLTGGQSHSRNPNQVAHLHQDHLYQYQQQQQQPAGLVGTPRGYLQFFARLAPISFGSSGQGNAHKMYTASQQVGQLAGQAGAYYVTTKNGDRQQQDGNNSAQQHMSHAASHQYPNQLNHHHQQQQQQLMGAHAHAHHLHHHPHHPHLHHQHQQHSYPVTTASNSSLGSSGAFATSAVRRTTGWLRDFCSKRCLFVTCMMLILFIFILVISLSAYLNFLTSANKVSLQPMSGRFRVMLDSMEPDDDDGGGGGGGSGTSNNNNNQTTSTAQALRALVAHNSSSQTGATSKTSQEFLQRQRDFETILRGALDRTQPTLKTYPNHLVKLEVYSFKPNQQQQQQPPTLSNDLWVYFRLFVNKRSLQQDGQLMKRKSPDEQFDRQFLPRLTQQTLLNGFEQLITTFGAPSSVPPTLTATSGGGGLQTGAASGARLALAGGKPVADQSAALDKLAGQQLGVNSRRFGQPAGDLQASSNSGWLPSRRTSRAIAVASAAHHQFASTNANKSLLSSSQQQQLKSFDEQISRLMPLIGAIDLQSIFVTPEFDMIQTMQQQQQAAPPTSQIMSETLKASRPMTQPTATTTTTSTTTPATTTVGQQPSRDNNNNNNGNNVMVANGANNAGDQYETIQDNNNSNNNNNKLSPLTSSKPGEKQLTAGGQPADAGEPQVDAESDETTAPGRKPAAKFTLNQGYRENSTRPSSGESTRLAGSTTPPPSRPPTARADPNKESLFLVKHQQKPQTNGASSAKAGPTDKQAVVRLVSGQPVVSQSGETLGDKLAAQKAAERAKSQPASGLFVALPKATTDQQQNTTQTTRASANLATPATDVGASSTTSTTGRGSSTSKPAISIPELWQNTFSNKQNDSTLDSSNSADSIEVPNGPGARLRLITVTTIGNGSAGQRQSSNDSRAHLSSSEWQKISVLAVPDSGQGGGTMRAQLNASPSSTAPPVTTTTTGNTVAGSSARPPKVAPHLNLGGSIVSTGVSSNGQGQKPQRQQQQQQQHGSAVVLNRDLLNGGNNSTGLRTNTNNQQLKPAQPRQKLAKQRQSNGNSTIDGSGKPVQLTRTNTTPRASATTQSQQKPTKIKKVAASGESARNQTANDQTSASSKPPPSTATTNSKGIRIVDNFLASIGSAEQAQASQSSNRTTTTAAATGANSNAPTQLRQKESGGQTFLPTLPTTIELTRSTTSTPPKSTTPLAAPKASQTARQQPPQPIAESAPEVELRGADLDSAFVLASQQARPGTTSFSGQWRPLASSNGNSQDNNNGEPSSAVLDGRDFWSAANRTSSTPRPRSSSSRPAMANLSLIVATERLPATLNQASGSQSPFSMPSLMMTQPQQQQQQQPQQPQFSNRFRAQTASPRTTPPTNDFESHRVSRMRQSQAYSHRASDHVDPFGVSSSVSTVGSSSGSMSSSSSSSSSTTTSSLNLVDSALTSSTPPNTRIVDDFMITTDSNDGQNGRATTLLPPLVLSGLQSSGPISSVGSPRSRLLSDGGTPTISLVVPQGLKRTRGPFAFETLRSFAPAPPVETSSESISSPSEPVAPDSFEVSEPTATTSVRAERSSAERAEQMLRQQQQRSADQQLPVVTQEKLLLRKRLFIESEPGTRLTSSAASEDELHFLPSTSSPFAQLDGNDYDNQPADSARFGNRFSRMSATGNDELRPASTTRLPPTNNRCAYYGCRGRPSGEFVCLNSSQICDDFIDCQDETDELDCVSLLKLEPKTNKMSFSNGAGIIYLNRRGSLAPMCLDYFGPTTLADKQQQVQNNNNERRLEELVKQINAIGQYACSLQSFSRLVSVKINHHDLVDGLNEIKSSKLFHRLTVVETDDGQSSNRQQQVGAPTLQLDSFKASSRYQVSIGASSECPSQRTVFIKCGGFQCGQDSFNSAHPTAQAEANSAARRNGDESTSEATSSLELKHTRDNPAMNDFPWLVKLYHFNSLACHGYLIDESWLVAASECFANDTSNDRVTSGWSLGSWTAEISYEHYGNDDYKSIESNRRIVKDVLLPPFLQGVGVAMAHADGSTNNNLHSPPIVLAKLERPVRFSPLNRPICLPSTNTPQARNKTTNTTTPHKNTEFSPTNYRNCLTAYLPIVDGNVGKPTPNSESSPPTQSNHNHHKQPDMILNKVELAKAEDCFHQDLNEARREQVKNLICADGISKTERNSNGDDDGFPSSTPFSSSSHRNDSATRVLICSQSIMTNNENLEISSKLRSKWVVVGFQFKQGQAGDRLPAVRAGAQLFVSVASQIDWIVDTMNPKSLLSGNDDDGKINPHRSVSGSNNNNNNNNNGSSPADYTNTPFHLHLSSGAEHTNELNPLFNNNNQQQQPCTRFKCSSGECLSWSRICDGLYDCSSHDDEKDCHK